MFKGYWISIGFLLACGGERNEITLRQATPLECPEGGTAMQDSGGVYLSCNGVDAEPTPAWTEVDAPPAPGACVAPGRYRVEYTQPASGTGQCADMEPFEFEVVDPNQPPPAAPSEPTDEPATDPLESPCDGKFYTLADECQWLDVTSCNYDLEFDDGAPYTAAVSWREVRDDAVGRGTVVRAITWSVAGAPFDGCQSTYTTLVVRLP